MKKTKFVDLDSPTLDKPGVLEEVNQIIESESCRKHETIFVLRSQEEGEPKKGTGSYT